MAVPLAGAASASTGPGNGQTGTLTGSSATVYDDVYAPGWAWVQCNETQHPKFDAIECQFLSGDPAKGGVKTAIPSIANLSGTEAWNSDFHDRATSGTLTFTVNSDGTGYTAKATY
jgi:hypothetical protein